MLRAPGSLAGPLRPAAAAGLLLLLIAAVVLVLGRVAFSSDPAQFEDAILAVGLAVLVGAALASLLVPAAIRPPTPDPWPASYREVPLDVAPAGVPAAVATAPRAASSIPASYVAAMYAPPASVETASDYSGPIAAALPFAAFPRPAGPREDGTFAEGAPTLDVELARLRARIHELEADRDLEVAPPWFAARSGGSRDLSPLAGGVGGPVRPLVGGSARCVGCGASVSAQAADPLCGNCGRPLCESCGGAPGPTVGLRRCPECTVQGIRNGAVAVSGGRSSSGSGGAGQPL